MVFSNHFSILQPRATEKLHIPTVHKFYGATCNGNETCANVPKNLKTSKKPPFLLVKSENLTCDLGI